MLRDDATDLLVYERITMYKMQFRIFIAVTFCFPIITVEPEREGVVIILNGTSCAGKSTLSKKLQSVLGKSSHIISSDDLEEEKKSALLKEQEYISAEQNDQIDREAIKQALSCAKKEAKNGKTIIVDAFIPHEGYLQVLSGEKKIMVLVYAPLPELLLRDRQRREVIERDAKKQDGALGYVLSSFLTLYKLAEKEDGKKIGTIKRSELEQFRDEISTQVEYSFVEASQRKIIAKFFTTGQKSVAIEPCFKHDYVVNISDQNDEESILFIKQYLEKFQ